MAGETWYIDVRPNGEDESVAGCVSAYLWLAGKRKADYSTKVEFRLRLVHPTNAARERCSKRWASTYTIKGKSNWGFPRLLTPEEIEEFIWNGGNLVMEVSIRKV